MSGLILGKAGEGKVPFGEGMEALGVANKGSSPGGWSLHPHSSRKYMLEGALVASHDSR